MFLIPVSELKKRGGNNMSENRKIVLDVHEKPSIGQGISLSFQHLFAMFGATVLVPYLVGLDPSVALLTSGLGTLAYLLITKGKIPIYLGSSFAFIGPLLALKAAGGESYQMMAVFIVGVAYALVALLVKSVGVKRILKFLPPIVIGPIVIGIGLSLAATAVNMAAYIGADRATGVFSLKYVVIALITLAITIIFSNFVKGFFGLIPILMGIVGGYVTATLFGVVDFEPVRQASWLAMPDVMIPFSDYQPTFNGTIFFAVIFVVIAPIAEHVGNVSLLGRVAGKNFIQKPGLHRSIFGDSVSIIIASIFGGVPNTTYGENIGVMTLTKVFSVWVIAGAATFAVLFSFIGKISAFIKTIPTPVMGGVSLLLFGIIAAGGVRMLVENKVDLGINRNLVIASTILTFSVGGMLIDFKIGSYSFSVAGIGLSAVVGVLLNLILPNRKAGFGENQEHV